MPADKEIHKIIKGSELREMADFLSNPESKIESCILCYQTDDNIGYMMLGESSIPALIGLLDISKDQIRLIAHHMLNDDEEDEGED